MIYNTFPHYRLLSALVFSLIVASLLSSVTACNSKSKSTTEEERLMVVEYVIPQKQSVVETVLLTGTVRAENRSMVAANTSGKIIERYVDVGETVKKGQVLTRLETSALNAQYQQAKALLEIARQQVNIAKSGARPEEIAQLKEQETASLTAFQTTEDNYNRQKKLFQDGVIPQSAFDQALAARDASKAQLESIRLSLKMAQTGARPEDLKIASLSVESAQNQVNALGATIGYASVRAPFDGIVNLRNYEVGEYAGLGDALFEIIGDGLRKVVVDVPATLITQLAKSNSVYAVIGEERREGFILKTHPAVNETTRTGVIEVGFQNTSDLVVGGFVEVEFSTTLASNVVTLPRICVQDPGDSPFVWVATDSGKVVKANVVVGAASRHMFEIKNGLSGTEKVLITGMSLVSTEGQYEVKPYDTTQDGAEQVINHTNENGESANLSTNDVSTHSNDIPSIANEDSDQTSIDSTDDDNKQAGNDERGDKAKSGGSR